MKNGNLIISILISQSPLEAFEAINEVSSWWTGEPGVEGNTRNIGDEFTYRYKNVHYSKQKLTELLPGKKIVWLVTESSLNFIEDKNEWTGTQISFDIFETNGQTEIRFTHHGLVPAKECYDDCCNAWGSYISGSLRNFISSKFFKSAAQAKAMQ